MNEREKMLSGKIYDSMDPELERLRANASDLCDKFNLCSLYDVERAEILNRLFPSHGDNLAITGPLHVDYGIHTRIGSKVFINYNLVILDCCLVEIGDGTQIGPNCAIYTALHPLHPDDREWKENEDGILSDKEYAKPVKIGPRCWLGGNVTVLPGAEIGEGCVIGAGSVVTGHIPPFSLAYGNPCKVVRSITEKDRLKYHPELFD